MRRFLTTVFILITAFVLQGTLFSYLNLGNTCPNLLLILSVSLGLMRGRKTGLLTGFFSGLLIDIFFSSYIGFFALLLMYLGYFGGAFHRVFFADDIKLPLTLIFTTDMIYGFICYLFFFLLKGDLNISFYLMNICIPECVYTVLIAILFYPILRWINRLLEAGERKRAKKFV